MIMCMGGSFGYGRPIMFCMDRLMDTMVKNITGASIVAS